MDLTKREVDILRLLARGMSDKDISNTLGIEPKTVQVHTANMYRKANMPKGYNRRCSLVAIAVKEGYVQSADFCDEKISFTGRQLDLLDGVGSIRV